MKKKILIVLFLLSLVLSGSACGATTQSSESTVSSIEKVSTTEEVSVIDPQKSTYEKAVESLNQIHGVNRSVTI